MFPGVLGVDAFGPADVFYFADYLAERAGEPDLPYSVEFAAAEAGVIPTAAGPSIHADRSIHDPDLRPDVLLVAGGLAAVTMARDGDFVAGVAGLAERSGEVGSVRTGAVSWQRPVCSMDDERPPTGPSPTRSRPSTPSLTWTPTGSSSTTGSGARPA